MLTVGLNAETFIICTPFKVACSPIWAFLSTDIYIITHQHIFYITSNTNYEWVLRLCLTVYLFPQVYLDISFASDPEIKFPMVMISPHLNLGPDETRQPYPPVAFGGPSSSDFPPPAACFVPPPGENAYGHPAAFGSGYSTVPQQPPMYSAYPTVPGAQPYPTVPGAQPLLPAHAWCTALPAHAWCTTLPAHAWCTALPAHAWCTALPAHAWCTAWCTACHVLCSTHGQGSGLQQPHATDCFSIWT